MARSDRLFRILAILRDGGLHRAQDIADQLGVSVRTIYRDFDTLAASGVPVAGTRGTGYRMADRIALPPLSLTEAELEALNLGIAIVAEATDPHLSAAARALGAKLDAVLPETLAPPDAAWQLVTYPFGDVARGFSHMATLRAAIRTRQKLELRYRQDDGTERRTTIRPLALEHWARIWALTGWDETAGDFTVLRVDLIVAVKALPELFVDEPGKRMTDYRTRVRPER